MSDITKTDVQDSIRAAARNIDEAIARACAVEGLDLACTDALWAARDELAVALRWV